MSHILKILFIISLLPTTMQARILDDADLSVADTEAFNSEIKILRRIGHSIGLSIALCGGQTICKLSVNQDELRRLIQIIDKRIAEMVVRRQQGTAAEEDIDKMMDIYSEQRAQYLNYMDELVTKLSVTMGSDEDALEDTFADTFSDSSKELTDDEELDFSSDFDAENDINEFVEDVDEAQGNIVELEENATEYNDDGEPASAPSIEAE